MRHLILLVCAFLFVCIIGFTMASAATVVVKTGTACPNATTECANNGCEGDVKAVTYATRVYGRGYYVTPRVYGRPAVRVNVATPAVNVAVERRQVDYRIVEEPRSPWVTRGLFGRDRVIIPNRTDLRIERY